MFRSDTEEESLLSGHLDHRGLIHESGPNYPAVVRESLELGDEEQLARVPVGKDEAKADQEADAQGGPGDREELPPAHCVTEEPRHPEHLDGRGQAEGEAPTRVGKPEAEWLGV